MLRSAGNGDAASPAAVALQRQAYRARRWVAISGVRPAIFRNKYDRTSLIGFEQAGLSRYARPGYWNDPDMLEIGNGGMTLDEYKPT